MTALLLALSLAVHPACWGDGHNQHRSRVEVRKFRAAHPCPATGKRFGACPGWQVDHICPLACCGPDKASNMQWLTAAQNHAKSDDCSSCPVVHKEK